MSVLPDCRYVDVSGRAILLRADLDVPMGKGRILDRSLIERLAMTVRGLSARGAKIVIVGHMGNPHGIDLSLSLLPVAQALSDALDQPVRFVEQCSGDIAEMMVRSLPRGGVAMLENLRFRPGEKDNQRNFALRLSMLADLFVNDAPGCASESLASTVGICHFLPAFAGPHLIAAMETRAFRRLPAIAALLNTTQKLKESA